jgi:hypothetical protein
MTRPAAVAVIVPPDPDHDLPRARCPRCRAVLFELFEGRLRLVLPGKVTSIHAEGGHRDAQRHQASVPFTLFWDLGVPLPCSGCGGNVVVVR